MMEAIIPQTDHDSLESGGSENYQNRRVSISHLHHRRQYNFGVSDVSVKIIVVLVMIGVSCLIVISQPSYTSRLYNQISSSSPLSLSETRNDAELEKSCGGLMTMFDERNPLSTFTNREIKELKRSLKKAAMADGKTVILTTINAAWTDTNSIFDLFLQSFRIGNQTHKLLNHLVVASFDETAHSRCLAADLHCFFLTTPGVNFSGEAYFMTDDYLKMVWRKIDFQRIVLQLGYNFVFSDADVMWLRDPFTRFHPDADFQIACDLFGFNPSDLRNSPNSGFIYVKSNNRTLSFYRFWYNGRDYFPGKHDQDVLNMIKSAPYVKNLGLEMRFLDTAYFGGFCEPSKDLDVAITMHANCCVGLENKIHDIKMVIDDWNRYMSLPSDLEKNISSKSWTTPGRCH